MLSGEPLRTGTATCRRSRPAARTGHTGAPAPRGRRGGFPRWIPGGGPAGGASPPRPSPSSGKTIRVGPGRTGIKVTTSNTVIDGYSIIGSQATTYNVNEYGIDVEGTASHHLHNIVIRNCYVGRFGNTGIWLQYVDSFTIENCTIEDSVCAVICVFCGINGLIQSIHIRRIG